MKRITEILLLLIGVFLPLGFLASADSPLGIFEKHGDIGDVRKPGAAEYDAARKSYTITGGGENMWATADAFHFVWKQMSGDVSLAADISLVGAGGNPHRKACLIIRQSLDQDSVYADAALHGEGLTSLQYREVKGGPTREIQANVSAPRRIRIEKQGDYVFMSIAREGEPLQSAGGSFRIKLTEPFYVGLGVCAHDNNALEKAIFSNVELTNPGPQSGGQAVLESTLETIAISSKDRRVVYHVRDHFEAPNWSRDGKFFLFNQGGRMYKLPVGDKEPQLIDSGSSTHCNNDHGISPDGTQLAISDQSQGDHKSRIFILPIT
ncbi:MAG: hypothetical protein J2P31_09535, partial [Blastocatellia bacterium]|nr:hypothetical protein [Blastocatellia bacterium]